MAFLWGGGSSSWVQVDTPGMKVQKAVVRRGDNLGSVGESTRVQISSTHTEAGYDSTRLQPCKPLGERNRKLPG